VNSGAKLEINQATSVLLYMTLTITQDELQDLTSPVTGDVQPQPASPDLDDEEDTLDFEGSDEVITPDVFTLKAHAECLRVGGNFRRLCDEIDQHAPYIMTMRRAFDFKNGYGGHKLKFAEFPNPVDFHDYCRKVYNLSVSRIMQLINKKLENVKPPAKKIPLEERPDYLKGLTAGREHAETQAVAKGIDVKSKLADIVSDEPITQVLTQGEREAIAAIASKRAEIIAEELYATLSGDRQMTSFEITQVVAELTKLNRPTTKPMANRFQAAAQA